MANKEETCGESIFSIAFLIFFLHQLLFKTHDMALAPRLASPHLTHIAFQHWQVWMTQACDYFYMLSVKLSMDLNIRISSSVLEYRVSKIDL